MNIVLTGFMGTGKTLVGRLLAEKTGFEFMDTDALIESKTGMNISKIFENFGEEYFRKLETDVIKEVARLDRKVISTGGGVVLKKENMDALRSNGRIINLKARPETIYSRLKDKTDRPLLKKENVLDEIRRLMDLRKPYYENCDFAIDTDELPASKIVELILKTAEAMERRTTLL